MSLVTFNFESQCLHNNMTVGIILPDRPGNMTPKEFYESGKKYKVLWLLHGTFGDYSDWIRRTMIEIYATERDLIVVMPSALNTNYANWTSFGLGYNMYDYLFDELMPLVYNWFPASDKREDNFIAGLSMGGRGTCVYAFNHPEKFGGACILSACPSDLKEQKKVGGGMWERMSKSAANYESEDDFLNGYENSLQVLREKVAAGVEMPKLLFGCGEEDAMVYGNLKAFEKEAKKMGLKADFFYAPNRRHEWRFWDEGIEYALDYFGIKKRG